MLLTTMAGAIFALGCSGNTGGAGPEAGQEENTAPGRGRSGVFAGGTLSRSGSYKVLHGLGDTIGTGERKGKTYYYKER